MQQKVFKAAAATPTQKETCHRMCAAKGKNEPAKQSHGSVQAYRTNNILARMKRCRKNINREPLAGESQAKREVGESERQIGLNVKKYK